jgi:NADH:ubiquinone oxidoreductase subunit 3 (subunit A)
MFFQSNQYFNILIYTIVAFLIVVILCILSILLNKHTKFNKSKLINYETGCLPTADNISNINIHFFIIGIIFLILDIEIILLFP